MVTKTESASPFNQNVRYNRPGKSRHQAFASANKKNDRKQQAQPIANPLKDPRAEQRWGDRTTSVRMLCESRKSSVKRDLRVGKEANHLHAGSVPPTPTRATIEAHFA